MLMLLFLPKGGLVRMTLYRLPGSLASVLLERIKASKETEQPKKKTKKVKAKSK